MAEDEDELWVGAMRTLIKRMTGRRGFLMRPVSTLLKTVVHELELALPLPADAVLGRVESVLASLSQVFDFPPQSDTGRRRIRGIVAVGAFGVPVVVTVDLSPAQAGGTTLKLRAMAKEGLIGKRRTAEKAEKAAQAVAELLTQPDGKDSTLAAHTWFEVDPSDAAEMSDAELAFAAALRAYSSAWTPTDVDGYVAGFAYGLEEPVACADLSDPADPSRFLVRAGVHLLGDRVRGDRLHSQLFSLPERPSSWALDSVGAYDQLAELSAHWFRRVLDKPIVLYVWLHDDYAYAARYAFADTSETLTQYYAEKLAPAGQAADLIAAGHVHGKGWIQTVGLPNPNCYLHIRGDLTKGTVLPGVPATTKRGPLGGFWYEGH